MMEVMEENRVQKLSTHQSPNGSRPKQKISTYRSHTFYGENCTLARIHTFKQRCWWNCNFLINDMLYIHLMAYYLQGIQFTKQMMIIRVFGAGLSRWIIGKMQCEISLIPAYIFLMSEEKLRSVRTKCMHV